MPYIPLNRIQPNLYTAGNEYYRLYDGSEYVGSYHKLYNGTFFTGKNPNDGKPEPLGKYSDTLPVEDGTVTYATLDYYEGSDVYDINIDTTTQYLFLKNKNPNAQKPRKLPKPYQPILQDSDYTLGEFQRYFVKKVNQLSFVEIDITQYQGFSSGNNEYYWQYYITMQLPWKITGEKEEVAKVNRSMVLLTEQKNNIRGLQEFLDYDYLKFYKS